jgi:peptidoglycan-associated lipoprotein
MAGEGNGGRASAGSGQGPSEVASAATGERAGQGEGAAGVTMAAARPELREFVAVSELGDVHFDFDRYDIRPEDAHVLDANAEWLKANPERVLLIEGHCDERGTNEYNLALGEHRAKSAMNYLISQGVQSNRMTIISYGEERPACTDKNESCWATNRRAHFLVKSR